MDDTKNPPETQLTLFSSAPFPPSKADCAEASPPPRPPGEVSGDESPAEHVSDEADTDADAEKPSVPTAAAPDAEAEIADVSADADGTGCAKGKKSTDTSIKPKFVPPLRFGPENNEYKGKLYLSPTLLFSVNMRRQKKGFYAISGTLGMIDPSTGYLMQQSNDCRHEIDRKRADKGLAPVAHKHAYRTAVTAEINVKYQKNPNYTQALKAETIKKAQMLANKNRDLMNFCLLAGTPLEKLPLGIVFDGFGTAYLNSRTKSAKMRPEYARRILQVANVMGELPLEQWSLQRLQKLKKDHPEINKKNIDEVLRFLGDTANHRGTANPAAVCLQAFIDREPKKSRKNTNALQKESTNATILPERVEHTLDKAASEHLGDPEYLSYILVKECGLDIEDICALQIKHILFHRADPLKVFIALRKNYAGSATHDYIFPLLPSGAAYLRQYVSILQTQYGDVRMQENCFLLSEDPTGTTKYDAKKLKDFLTQLIQKEKMGYAALANLKNLQKNCKSVVLLKGTYKARIKSIFSGRENQTDDNGAITFLCHEPLVASVQSNHYRAFSDATGKNYLYDSLRKDPRDPFRFQSVEKEQGYRRKSVKHLETGKKLITYPAKASGHSFQTLDITLDGLEPGSILTLESEHGLFCIPIKAGA